MNCTFERQRDDKTAAPGKETKMVPPMFLLAHVLVLFGFWQVVIAEGPFFTGSTLKLRANRGPSPDYDFVKAIAGPHDVSCCCRCCCLFSCCMAEPPLLPTTLFEKALRHRGRQCSSCEN